MDFPRMDKGPLREERVAVRHGVCVQAQLQRRGHHPIDVVLTDISAFGCRVQIAQPTNVGSFVTLKIAPAHSLPGWVVWSHTKQVGISFAHDLQEEAILLSD